MRTQQVSEKLRKIDVTLRLGALRSQLMALNCFLPPLDEAGWRPGCSPLPVWEGACWAAALCLYGKEPAALCTGACNLMHPKPAAFLGRV